MKHHYVASAAILGALGLGVITLGAPAVAIAYDQPPGVPAKVPDVPDGTPTPTAPEYNYPEYADPDDSLPAPAEPTGAAGPESVRAEAFRLGGLALAGAGIVVAGAWLVRRSQDLG